MRRVRLYPFSILGIIIMATPSLLVQLDIRRVQSSSPRMARGKAFWVWDGYSTALSGSTGTDIDLSVCSFY